jgi:hypothetical protein
MENLVHPDNPDNQGKQEFKVRKVHPDNQDSLDSLDKQEHLELQDQLVRADPRGQLVEIMAEVLTLVLEQLQLEVVMIQLK